MGGGTGAAIRRTVSVVLTLAVLGSAFPAEACVTVYASASAPRAITIVGDSQFLTTPEVKGGAGTPADPYRIEDLTITNPSFSAISISNTNLSFLIRNVTITRPPPDPNDGRGCCTGAIHLFNAKNGRIVDSVVRWGRYGGISLYGVTDVVVENTLVEGGQPGILIQESTRVSLLGNHLVNTTVRIEGAAVENAASHTITEDNLVDGLPILYRANCAHETVAARMVAIALIANCTDVRLQGIQAASENGEVRVRWSSDVTVADVNASSVFLSQVERATVRGSTFSLLNVEAFRDVAVEGSGSPLEKGTSIRAINGTGLRIEGNNFRGAGVPIIRLGDDPPHGCACLPGAPPRMTVNDAVVLGNTLRDNAREGIVVKDAPAAVIRGNRILNVTFGVEGNQVPGVIVEDNEFTSSGTGTGIELSGEGSAVLNNTMTGYRVGISTIGADNLDIVGNVIQSQDAGLSLGTRWAYHVDDNHLTGGSVSFDYAWQLAAFELGPNNTINGLPLRFHRGCNNVTYDGALLGAVVFIDCENIRLSNMSFKDVSQPIILMGIWQVALEDLIVENASMGIAFRSVWVGSLNRSVLRETGGVEIYDALEMSLSDNLIENGSRGVTVYNAGAIEFNRNRIEGGEMGPMVLYNDYDLKFNGNSFVGGGILMYGNEPDNYGSHEFDSANTVDGLPLVYVSNQSGVTVDPQPIGQLIIANCTGVTIRGLVANGAGPLMTLAFLKGVSISNVSLGSSRLSAWTATQVEGLTMEDSTIEAGSAPGWYLPAALLEGAAAVRFERVTFNSSGGAGLEADSVGDFTISNSTLVGYYGGARLSDTDGLSVQASSFSGPVGGLSVERANNTTIEGSRFREGGGIWIGNSRQSAVLDNDFDGLAGTAVSIVTSTELVVRDNTIRNSSVGISFRGSRDASSVTVERNVIQFNSVGIDLNLYAYPSATHNNVLIRNNTVEQNGIGVTGNNSKGVTLMHNRFLNNTVQARVVTGAAWDGGYLVGGNYWSDYVGKDECSGVNQDVCPDPDQFGDAPYCVGAPTGAIEGFDRYPLMTLIAPPARQPPPPPIVPPTPTALDPIGAGLPALALILAFLAAGVFISMRRKPIERLEEEEIERLS